MNKKTAARPKTDEKLKAQSGLSAEAPNVAATETGVVSLVQEDAKVQTSKEIREERHVGKDTAEYQSEVTLSVENLERLQALGMFSQTEYYL